MNFYLDYDKKVTMSQIALNTPAPDFELADFNGKLIRLSDQIGKTNVLLVFNRGFM
jgi:peroxiredoxin